MLSHRERLLACLANDPILDRPPVALWRHFPVDDQTPDTLVEALLAFQRLYNLDIVKVTPASSYCLKDWGAEDVWEGNIEGTRRYLSRVIQKPEDWEELPLLEPSAHHLSNQISCLIQLRHILGPDIPILQTIFSPLSQAKNLAGQSVLLDHLHNNPDSVMIGLATIAETIRKFILATIDAGVDGIFYAVQHAQNRIMTEEDYLTFGVPYDMKALSPAQNLWCNILHLHGNELHFNIISDHLLQDQLFQIVNWHDRETWPTLTEAKKIVSLVLCGGIDQNSVTYKDANQVRREAEDAIQQTNGKKFILGTGCVVPIIAPHGNILAVRQAVEIR